MPWWNSCSLSINIYRTDPKRHRYTGALCGLGYDDEGMSVLPDHDIELTFETKFDTDDVAMVSLIVVIFCCICLYWVHVHLATRNLFLIL